MKRFYEFVLCVLELELYFVSRGSSQIFGFERSMMLSMLDKMDVFKNKVFSGESKLEINYEEGGGLNGFEEVEGGVGRVYEELVERAGRVCFAAGNCIACSGGYATPGDLRESQLYYQVAIALDDFYSYLNHVISLAAGEKTASDMFIDKLLSKEE